MKRIRIGALVLLCLGGAAGLLVLRRGSLPAPAEALIRIPDPDTSAMQPRVAAAIREARAMVLRSPSSADAWGRLGQVCDAHLLYEEAEASYRGAIRLAPGDSRWAYLLAVIAELRAAPLEEVRLRFDAAAAVAPLYPPLHVRYGDALVRHGLLEDAAESYRRALSVDPELAIARRSLGSVLVALDRPTEALEHLERAAGLTPNDGLVHAALAQARARLGDAEGAASASHRARRLPSNLGLPDPLRFEVEGLGVGSEQCDDRAETLMRQGDYEGAIRNLEIVREVRPAEAPVLARLGKAYMRGGRTAEAIETLSRAVVLQEDLLEARLDLGALLAAAGRLPEAIDHFRTAVAQAPESPEAHFRLGLALEQSRDRTGAIEHYRAAAALDRTHRGAAQRLAELDR